MKFIKVRRNDQKSDLLINADQIESINLNPGGQAAVVTMVSRSTHILTMNELHDFLSKLSNYNSYLKNALETFQPGEEF